MHVMPRAYEPSSDEPSWLAFGPPDTEEDLIRQLDAMDSLVDLPPAYLDSDRPARPLRLEPGRQAAESLMRVMGDTLIQLMLRPDFEAIDEQDVVPVLPCPYCGDGALRLAGTLRVRGDLELVRSCDTCGSVQVGQTLLRPDAH
jgi:hypothetical protein